jgi:hypothetical protein
LEFTLGAPLRVPITIDGVVYRFAKFLGEAFEERVETYRRETIDSALKEFKPDDRLGRAQFRQNFPMPPVDVLYVEGELKTPKGCDDVIRWCGSRAEPPVPPEKLEQLLKETPVPLKRQVVSVLLGMSNFREAMKKDSGEPAAPEEGASPLPSSGGPTNPPQPTSADARIPGTSTPQSTEPPTTTTPAA